MTLLKQQIPALRIDLFGPFEARVNEAPLPRLRSRKVQSLLALLTLRAGSEIERTWLAGALWPDSPESTALATLRRDLTSLRRALGPAADRLRSPTPRTLCLDLAEGEADVLAFAAAVKRADTASLEEAVALYRGPLLEGCAEEWAFQERQAREQAYLQALESLAARALARADPAASERYLRRAIAVEPLRESAQRALMQALAAGGNYAAALLVYRELRLRLHREINVEPDPETQALFQQLRAEARGKADGGTGRQGDGATDKGGPVFDVAGRPFAPSPRLPVSPSLPSGTVTFLFTDIEGSSRLWEEHPEAMQSALARHDALLRQVIETHAGHVFKTMGDQFCAAFATPAPAVAAAVEAQHALQPEAWGEGGSLRVRMALSTGAVEQRDGDYFGPALNRVARLLAAGHGGQVLLSQATADLVREALPPELSLLDLGAHRLKDLQQPEHVFQLFSRDLPWDFPPLRSLAAFAHNLPAQLTSFIGREEAMAEVKQFLATTRLLTLTGSGGCGKTRLALQVGADLLEAYADGVWLVELAALADPSLVPQTVAAALGVREQPGRPLTETLVDYLKPKALLLILDNCEHLLAACAQLADALLRSCPSLRLLASSREGLGIGGERTYRVPSLSLPQHRPLPPVECLTEYEAVRLFVERAVFTQPSFGVSDQNASAVVQVCERLDGIPLALELAAARVKALPVEKLNERLDDMFRLLTGGSRTALPRQQTLRALIDWSYDLLSEPERALLRRLSAFAGGWTLEAAEAVCVGGGPTEGGSRVEEWEVLDLLTSLVEKSLVLYEEREGEARYRLLETVRQYAHDRLLEAREAAAVRRRHYDWCLALAEEAEPDLYSAARTASLDRLEREHDNLRAALGWSGAHGEGEAGLRLGGALGQFWVVRAYWTEGREHLAGMLALPGAQARTAARAKALHAAAWLAWLYEGNLTAARALDEQSLAIFRELGDNRGIADSLNHMGRVSHEQGDDGAARAFLEEGLAISREIGHKAGIGWSLGWLGLMGQGQPARVLLEESLAIFREQGNKLGIPIALDGLASVARDEGDYGAYRTLHEECLAINRELGHKLGIALDLDTLGELARNQGDYGAARALLEESLAIWQEMGNKGGIAWSLGELGNVARDQGDYGSARALLEESLSIFQELGQKSEIGANLEWLAALAVAQGQPERAAHLFGAAEGLREAMGAPLPPAERAEHDRSVTAVRTSLGEEAFAAAWAEGRAMELEEAIEEALQQAAAG